MLEPRVTGSGVSAAIRSVVGRTIMIDARPMLVVGVMPRGFRIGDAEADVIWPAGFDRGNGSRSAGIAGFSYQAVARLRPGITIAQANADVARMIPIWMRLLVGWTGHNVRESMRPGKSRPPCVLSKDDVVGGVDRRAVGGDGDHRPGDAHRLRQRRESAAGPGRGRGSGSCPCVRRSVRAADGSSRSLLVESVVLGLIGGAVGTGLAYGGLRVLVAVGPANLPRLSEISLDTRTFAFAAALVAAVERVVRIDPCAEIHGTADFGGAGQPRPHREREPRAPPRPQRARSWCRWRSRSCSSSAPD